ncbi:MAG: ZPR1 zinc finger domain-containing protein [Nanoarchaeota archaeon]|nr:ZPR1 zinc finger domain-containing protein [Nanoarchaeota archaeon]
MSELKEQECPACKEKTLTLTEQSYNIPHFGRCFLMSMTCSNCHYHISDVESEETKPPIKITFTIENSKDLNVKVIKSSQASIKIPQLRMSSESGPSSIGFITNIEGLLKRFKKIVEGQRDSTEDPAIRKKAKNLLKKFWKVETGDLQLKIIIEDPSGNSIIISEKAKIKKL